MASQFALGCQRRGIRHVDEVSVDEKFRLVRDSGVYDYIDILPLPAVRDDYVRCSERYGIPILTGSVTYQVGRDEVLTEENLRTCAQMSSRMHNLMVLARHQDGHLLSEAEVAECYLRTQDLAQNVGVSISFEVHVNNWSERFLMVRPVADLVRNRGVAFNLTADYSHCIFKIEQPEELEISGIREQVESGEVVLDPFEKGSLIEQWLAMNVVAYAQFQPAVPNGPRNLWAIDPNTGEPRRGIQYPFLCAPDRAIGIRPGTPGNLNLRKGLLARCCAVISTLRTVRYAL